MGSAEINGRLWSAAPEAWATIQEPFHAPLFAAMLNAAGVDEHTRVLDVGCGGGVATAMAVARGAQVVGVDAAEGLVDYASRAVPGATFHVGDMEHLNFDDGSFDVVFAANAVQYAEHLVGALRELGRVCRKDGRIVVGIFGPAERVAYAAVLAAAKEAMPPPPPGAKPGGPFALSGEGVLAGRLAEAGLTVIAHGEANCPFEYRSAEEFWRAQLGAGPMQSMVSRIGEKKLRAAVEAACKRVTAADGRIRFDPNVFVYLLATP